MVDKQEPQTEFDKAVAAVQGDMFTVNKEDITGVALLLQNAGVASTKIAEIQANRSMVALIKSNPSLAQRFAEMFPASYAINYYDVRQQLGFGLPSEDIYTSGGADALAHMAAEEATTTAPTGATEYPGGVLVDPTTQTVTFPPDDASLAGSPAWMSQVPKWSDEKMANWTRTLHKLGYIESKKVDLVTLTDALIQYHTNKYLYGGGAPVDLSVGGGQGIKKEDFGGILDPAVVRSEVVPWFQEAFGDDPSPAEADFWADKLTKTAMRLAKRTNMAPADAASVASARAQEKFRNDPATQKWQDLEETDTGLHDSFVNLFQVLSS